MSDKATTASAARFTRVLAVVFFLASVLIFANMVHKSYQLIAAEQALAALSAVQTTTPDACLDTEATITSRSSNGSTRTHREPRATYSYTYEVDGVGYTGRSTLEDTCDQPLGPMAITYRVAEPGKSELVALKDKRMRDAYLSPLAGLLMMLLAAWGARLLWREGDFKPEVEPPAAPPEGGDAW
jgi:predicted lipoprotein with Yx(FWY)xxD motif